MPVFSTVGSPQSSGGANPGRTYVFNNISNTNNIVVAPANSQRNTITFCNPGANTLLVSMTEQMDPLLGTQAPLTPTTAAPAGAIPLMANKVITIEGECQRAWQALASTGTSNPITVIDNCLIVVTGIG